MTVWYVDSNRGSGSNSGTSWANAWLSLESAIAANGVVAGDTIYVSSLHSETKTPSGTTWQYTSPGTNSNPVNILSVDATGDPVTPTTLQKGAAVTTTGISGITFSGPSLYAYGLVMLCGTGGSTNGYSMALSDSTIAARHVFEECDFDFANTSGGFAIGVFNNGFNLCEWRNCRAKLPGTGSTSSILHRNGVFRWLGGSMLPSASVIRLISGALSYNTPAEFSGVDLSGLGSASNLVDIGSRSNVLFRNCKLPASWSGVLATGTRTQGGRVLMHNCDNGDTNYKMWEEWYAGAIRDESTIVRTGGASDGTTSLAWKMTTNSSALYPAAALESPEIVRWNEDVGSPLTVDVEVVHDSQGGGTGGALTDKECWLEVQYLGTSGAPVSSFVRGYADVLATAADQPSSSETWTTTGLTTPVKQKLSVTFTPQEKGQIRARVHLAKASAIIYVDPKLTVS